MRISPCIAKDVATTGKPVVVLKGSNIKVAVDRPDQYIINGSRNSSIQDEAPKTVKKPDISTGAKTEEEMQMDDMKSSTREV